MRTLTYHRTKGGHTLQNKMRTHTVKQNEEISTTPHSEDTHIIQNHTYTCNEHWPLGQVPPGWWDPLPHTPPVYSGFLVLWLRARACASFRWCAEHAQSSGPGHELRAHTHPPPCHNSSQCSTMEHLKYKIFEYNKIYGISFIFMNLQYLLKKWYVYYFFAKQPILVQLYWYVVYVTVMKYLVINYQLIYMYILGKSTWLTS